MLSLQYIKRYSSAGIAKSIVPHKLKSETMCGNIDLWIYNISVIVVLYCYHFHMQEGLDPVQRTILCQELGNNFKF